MHTPPPYYQQAVMQSIESTVMIVREEFPNLIGADVEYAYQQLKEYYQGITKGKTMKEPTSSSERRQILMDEILNIIEEREEVEADLGIINNPDIQLDGKLIRSLPVLYLSCFIRLYKSARFWRKENGKTGYLQYISQFLEGES